jgi:hypothetical protein
MEELLKKYLTVIIFLAGCASFYFIGEIWHKPAFQKEIVEDRKFSMPVTIEMYTVINDGVTRRIVASKVVTDSITHKDTEMVNRSIREATHKMIALRQKEIDHNERYWRDAKFIDVGKEKDFTPVDISFIKDDN